MNTLVGTDPERTKALRPRTGSSTAAEAIKLWSLPAQRALLGVAVELALLSAVLIYLTLPVTEATTLARLAASDILSAGILGVDMATFVVIVAAAMHVGAEYSTGLIQTTLTIGNARWRVVAAKLLTAAALALTAGAASTIVCVVAAVVAAATVAVPAGAILTVEGLRLAAGAVSMPFIYAVIAATGAFLFRSTGMGIVTALAVMMIGGLAGWLGDAMAATVVPLMPVSAVHSLTGTAVGPEEIGVGGAIISLIAWSLAAFVVSTWRLTRSDA